LPAKGAFPELVESTGGGLLVDPDDPRALADGLYRLVRDPESRRRLGRIGREHVMTRRGVESQARQMIEMLGTQSLSR
jgi:glycosyltransferase involved in cell wall biosynthesis